ncbi:tripartite tricarboxylate transporter permease [Actinoalloteichus caeruleus]|uniref:tripartite tricarboxylate transporter permease n=1 Tax=Actinoalloteichus cyanogriseus TaxID=2893586 RepID=UPI0004AA2BA2|nr:tripartite tricarboxylate transporter permease [Actinoalloteichus caeruleus]
MLDAAASALGGFLDPQMILMLISGVLAGLVMGIIPGLGGTGAVAILLPFVFVLEPQQALALIIGATAVIHTSDTITAVLIGVPGSASATVTTLDGHAMAKQGQAARALSIAFISSMVGGLVGAIGLTLAIPLARPLVLMFGSPELFMLTVLGISLAALLSRGNVAKGLLAGAFGLLIGQIGAAPAAAEYRFTFGSLFLTEGLDLVAVALGTFGIAEIIALIARKTSVASKTGIGGGWGRGFRDVLTHWGQVLRGALVGVWAGVLPGIGATAGSWIAYGQAIATSKDKRRFGKGDPRGIAAPEGANTSIAAGDLIPTLLFGIPGSAAAALLLGALLVFGIEPGPRLITQDLDLVYTIIWSFALAAVLGAALCFLLAAPLARLSFIRFPVLAGGLVVIMFVAAFQASQEFGVMQVMLLLGVFGWLMKMCDYPRAPFLIGFVLSIPLERYYFLTESLYEPTEWLTRPGVVVMIAILLAPLLFKLVKALLRARRQRNAAPASVGAGATSEGTSPGAAGSGTDTDDQGERSNDATTGGDGAAAEPVISEPGPTFTGTYWPMSLAGVFLVVFGGAWVMSQGFGEDARLVPQLVAGIGVLLTLIVGVQEYRRWREERGRDAEWRTEVKWTAHALGWLCLYLAITWVIGAVLAAAVFVPLFLWRVASMRPVPIAIYTSVVVAALVLLQVLADISMPMGWFTPAFLA